MKVRSLLTLILIAQIAPASFSQKPAGPPPSAPVLQPQKPEDVDVVRITSNLVQVDAVVSDKNGKLVTDLKPQEVEIFEDGHKQKITNFSFALSPTVPAARAARSATTAKDAPPLPPTTL